MDDLLIREIFNYLSERPVTNPIEIIRISMEFVEKTKLKGSDKAKTVINALIKFINQAEPSQLIDDLKVIVYSNSLQSTIDAIVDAANGRYDIGTPASSSTSYTRGKLNIYSWNANMFGQ